MSLRRLGGLATIGVVALVLAGCGGDDEEEESVDVGPAAVVPTNAPAYFDVSVRPEGDARDDAEAAAGKILGSDDPGETLISLIEEAAAEEDPGFDWDEDVAPWLGQKVGFFPTSLAGESEVAVIAQTTDPDQALEFARSDAGITVGGREREYNGVSFQVDSEGDALGVVDDFLVSATPKGFKRVVDAARGDSLGDSDQFRDSVGELPGERLATLYAVPRDFLGAIPEEEIDPEGRNIFLKAIGESADTPVLGDLTASAENLELELSAAGGAVETEQSNLLNQLPGEAWLALGLGDIGGAIQNGLDSVESAEVKGLSGEQLRSQLDELTGLDLEQVAQALGGGALFVQGDSTLDLRGALIIQSGDETVSAELLDSIESLITSQAGTSGVRVTSLSAETGTTGGTSSETTTEGGETTTESSEPSVSTGFQVESEDLPQPIQVVQQGNRIIAGYGGGIVGEIINTSGKTSGLTGTPGFTKAEEAIGSLGLDAYVSFRPVIELAENLGGEDDPDFQTAKEYLTALDFLAIGSGNEDDRALLRFVIGLR
jgi:Protein of unknown function (DUF3352)